MSSGDEKLGASVFEVFRLAFRTERFELAEHMLRALEQLDQESGEHKLRDKALRLLSTKIQ